MVKNLPTVERSTKIRFGKHVPDSADQADNTIVFNASNTLVSTPNSEGIYMAPVRYRPDYADPNIVLMMYNRDTHELSESGERASSLIGGVTLQIATQRGNVTSNTTVFTGTDGERGISLMTSNAVGIANLFPQDHTLTVGSNLYVNDTGSNVLVVSGNVAVLRDMVIDGNLQVNGETTVIYTENITTKDALIELGKDNTGGDTTLDLGLLMHRPDPDSNVIIGFRESTDEIVVAYTDSKPTDKSFTPKTDEDIDVHVYGRVLTEANVGIVNTSPTHTLAVGTKFYVDENLSNVIYVKGNTDIVGELRTTGNIYAQSNIHVNGNVFVDQNVHVDDQLSITNNVYARKDVKVTGNVHATKNVHVGDHLTVANNLYASKDFTLAGNAFVSGNVHVSDHITVENNLYASKDFTLAGNAFVSGNVHVSDHITVENNLYASKDLTLAGNAFVSGNVHVSDHITVENNLYASKDLTLAGNAFVSGNVHVSDHITVANNLYASKDFTLAGNAFVSGNVHVSDHITVENNLYASKDFTLAGNAFVSGNIYVSKELSVTDNAYVSGNVEVTKALIVSGNTHLEGDNVFITNTMDFLDPKTAIVTDQVSNVQIRLGQLENVANTASNPLINQVLTYDQDNSEWSNAYPDQTIVQVKNTSGAPMTRGQAVHVTGSNGNNTFQIELADASDPTKMPAIGIVYEDIPINGQGAVVTFGRANGISGISGYTNGDTLYVASGTPGGLTNVKPYGVDLDLIQNVGVVVNHNSGVMFVTGIGRSNDIPNARIISELQDMQYVYVNNTNNDLKKIHHQNILYGGSFYKSLVQTFNITNINGYAETSFIETYPVITNATAGILRVTYASASSSSGNLEWIFQRKRGDVSTNQTVTFVGGGGSFDAIVQVAWLDGSEQFILIGNNFGSPAQLTLDVTEVEFIPDFEFTKGKVDIGSGVVNDTTASTSRTTGALTVAGGVGIAKDLYADDGNFTTNVSIGRLTETYFPFVETTTKNLIDSMMYQNGDDTIILNTDVQISGTLLVSGESFEVSSGELIIQDRIIDIANNNSDHTLDIGVLMEHPGYNIGIIHHGDHPHTFSLGYTQNGYADTHILRDVGNVMTVDIHGNLLTQNCLVVNENIHVVDGGLGINIGDGSDNANLGTNKLYVDGDVQVGKGTANLFVDVSTGKVGIMTNSPDYTLDVAGSISTDDYIIHNGDTNAKFGFPQDDTITFETSGSERVRIDSSGNVGVGTDSPTQKLEVAGSIIADDYLIHRGDTDTKIGFSDNDTFVINTSGTEHFKIGVDGNVYVTSNLIVDTNTLFVDKNTNRIGIKTLTPTSDLHIVGNVFATSNITTSSNVLINGDAVATSKTTGALQVAGGVGIEGDIYATDGTFSGDISAVAGVFSGAVSGTTGTFSGDLAVDTNVLKVNVTDNRVGINKTSPAVALDVVGDGTFTGDVSAVGGTFSGAVSGTTGTFTGDVSGVAGSFSGAVSGTTGTFSGVTSVTDTTNSGSKTTGALQVAGGVGIQLDIHAADATFDNLSVAANTDTAGIIGRAKVGYMGYSDFGGISHYDRASPGNYALIQSADGLTLINSSTGKDIQFRENNSVKMTLKGGNFGIGNATPSTKLVVAGGTITNSDQVAKKTYSYSGDLASAQTIANSTIKLTFTNHTFSAKVVAHLIESDNEVSTLSFECCGGNWAGDPPSNAIALGPVSIFGPASTNPWDPDVTTTTTTVSFKPTTNMADAGHYNVFVEYFSQNSAGELTSLHEGATTEVSDFGY
jgi:cytoskeletal protein CcmA (bactofilin family)